MTTVTLPREVAKQALDAFEEAKMGLEWYQTSHPESVDGSDDEAMERIDAGIASLRAALDAHAKPVSGDFIQRTNQDYATWCATFYKPEVLDERGQKSLDGLHAWQERDRLAQIAKPVDCRGCEHRNYFKGHCMTTIRCTNFDKFQALPPISLTRVTK